MKFRVPSEMWKGKALREHVGPFPVFITQTKTSKGEGDPMTYPTIEEILEMPAGEAQKLVIEIADGRTDAEAGKLLDIAGKHFKGLRMYLGIFKNSASRVSRVTTDGFDWWGKITTTDLNPSKVQGRTWGRTKRHKAYKPKTTEVEQNMAEEPMDEFTGVPEVVRAAPPAPSPQFSIRMSGVFNGTKLVELLDKAALIVNANDGYDVFVSIDLKEEASVEQT